jgi:hypothetical protein
MNHDFNRWQQYIRIQRIRTAHRLAVLYNDKPVMSAQERNRIEDKTRTIINNQ